MENILEIYIWDYMGVKSDFSQEARVLDRFASYFEVQQGVMLFYLYI